ncbi:MAG: hypothetical protein WDK96_00710 [Candidatus Paceibacterota bacterium]|jgi:hypothetical protein
MKKSKRRIFKHGDKVKCFLLLKPDFKGRWYSGVIDKIIPSEWVYPKWFWDEFKNPPFLEFVGYEDHHLWGKEAVRYKNHDHMLIFIKLDHIDYHTEEHFGKFQATVSLKERGQGNEGAYDGRSIIFNNEKEVDLLKLKKSKKLSDKHDDLPF